MPQLVRPGTQALRKARAKAKVKEKDPLKEERGKEKEAREKEKEEKARENEVKVKAKVTTSMMIGPSATNTTGGGRTTFPPTAFTMNPGAGVNPTGMDPSTQERRRMESLRKQTILEPLK